MQGLKKETPFHQVGLSDCLSVCLLVCLTSYHSLLFSLETKSFHMDSRSRPVLSGEAMEVPLDSILQELNGRIETKLDLGSDWVYKNFKHMDVLFLRYR